MGLHLLGEDQVDLARLFGEETGDLVDKFASVDWRLGSTGAPLLVEAAVSMEGQILGHFSVGDHEAFLMRAVRSVAGGHPGLLMFRDTPPLRPGHPPERRYLVFLASSLKEDEGGSGRHPKAKGCTRLIMLPESSRSVASIP